MSVASFKKSFGLIEKFSEKTVEEIRQEEEQVDSYEDKIGTYLVKLNAKNMSARDSSEVTELLHMISDFERISDHAVNVVKATEKMTDKDYSFSEAGMAEIKTMMSAVGEILDKALTAFKNNDAVVAAEIEPLEQVIDNLKTELKKRHIARLKEQQCTIEMGFVFSDIIGDLERVADHCSNIGSCVIEIQHDELKMHDYIRRIKNEFFEEKSEMYQKKYSI